MLDINLSKRERYIFIITGGIITAALLYNFILEPAFKKWQVLNREIEIKKARFDRGLVLLERKDSIIKEYNSYAKSSKDISKILNYIENLAGLLGVKTGNIKPYPLTQAGIYGEYKIELQIEGQLPELVKFLSELIKLPCFVTVQKFDLRAVSENSNIFKGTIILSKIII